MLFKNGHELGDAITSFIDSSHTLEIFSPYIKKQTLSLLLDECNVCTKVFVRWEPKDILSGSSDLDIYPYLKSKGICLFRNRRLHLKAYLNTNCCIITSANISSRALNLPINNNYNYELGTILKNITVADRMYFKIIENESILITDDIYGQIKMQLDEIETIKSDDFEINIQPPDKDFLVSSLPMSYSVSDLIKYYFSIDLANETEVDCLIHDLAIYGIPMGLGKSELLLNLSKAFFNHNFILCFLRNLDLKGEIYFGEAKAWIQNNCTNVPTPRRWELTINTQILYRWIVELGGGEYIVDRPNYSERLWKKIHHDD
jgi:hypothetical protein